MPDQLVIIGLTVIGCLLVGGLGLLVLRSLRTRSLRTQLIVAAATPVLAVAVAIAVNVRLMFLSTHDSGVAMIVLATSLVLSLISTTLVLRSVVAGSLALGRDVEGLVADSQPFGTVSVPTADGPAILPELARVREELAEARNTLAAARDRARRSERARQELVTFMSHDLRTPLAGMRAVVEGLQDGVVTDVPRAHDQLQSMVARMSGLVEDLFELSRVESAPDLVKAPVALAELVADVADELTPAAHRAEVELRVDVPADDRLPITGDADALARALSNLVSNAVRHTDRGGLVSLTARRQPDGRVLVSVVDGCGGIPDEALPRVFETGWRASPSRTVEDRDGEQSGAGLGLAIARRVVTSHDGSVGVTNVRGGCRFDLELPPR